MDSVQPREPVISRQDIQRKLVEDALKNPGVAAAVEVYGALAPYIPNVGIGPTGVKSATGGNA